MSLQLQNLITDTLFTLLASDHVFLMCLAEIDESSPPNGVAIVTMTYVMQKASATAPITTVCHALASAMSYCRPELPRRLGACTSIEVLA